MSAFNFKFSFLYDTQSIYVSSGEWLAFERFKIFMTLNQGPHFDNLLQNVTNSKVIVPNHHWNSVS